MGMPHFFGRSSELQQIKDLWKKACEGQPQVVNLIADTGVGKTRLVQAFYEWLSTEPEQGNGIGSQCYWPNVLGAGRQRVVNPPIEGFAAFDLKNDRIPWLWWGMYWTDADGENECGLVRFHDFIDVHLSMLELQRNAYRKTLATVSDAVKDEVIDLVAGLIPGGSQVRSVLDLAKKLHANRKEQQEAQKGLASQDQSRQETLAESIIERLHTAFSPNQQNGPNVPLILFLDDIHFATDISRDDFTLQFLDRLLRLAARNQWPLLVLTTHWKGPWQAHRKEGVSLKDGTSWACIALDLEAEQNIKTPDFQTLKLSNIPHDDLRSVVFDLLPGLDNDDQDKILSRIDNVRWLVEVLNALSDSTENFEDNERNRSLSIHGHRRLQNLLKTRGYLEVIRQRLEGDAMRDVRAVLGATAWHAHELEFLSPLACAFGKELVEQGALPQSDNEPGQQVLKVLLRALDPSALLEGQGYDNQLPNLVRFPERGYLEIAKELFDPTCLPALRLALGQEILAWMQEIKGEQPPRWKQLEDDRHQKSFLEIALTVLGQLQSQLSEEQQEELTAIEKMLLRRLKKGNINEQELQEELHETRKELLEEAEEPQLADAAQWQAVAMAELVNILKRENDGRAWTLAFELAEHPQLSAALQTIQIGTSVSLTYCWQDKAECWPKAYKLLDDIIQNQTALVEAEQNLNRLGGLTILQKRLAVLDKEAGKTEQARAGYQRCLAMRELLIAEYGESPDRLEDLANSLKDLAIIDSNCGYVDQARKACQSILAIYERLQREFGRPLKHLTGLAYTLLLKARIDQENGEHEQARAGYQRCLAIRENLIKESGESPERLRNLANTLLLMADLDKEEGDHGQARAGYQRNLSIHERLLVEFGEFPSRLTDVSIAIERLAAMDKAANDIDHAIAGHQRSLEIQERIISEYGYTPQRFRDIERTLSRLEKLAHQERVAGNTDQARKAYQRSLATWERLLDGFGETAERLRGLALTIEWLADLDRTNGDKEQARASFQRSLAIWERLLNGFGETADHLRGLTIPIERLADFDRANGAKDQARVGYQNSLEIWKRLIDEFGETPDRLRGLTIPLERLADLDRADGYTDQAKAGYKRSLAIRERLLNELGATPRRLQGMTFPLLRLADLERDTGANARAKEGYQRSVEVWDYLLDKFGETPERLRNLTIALERLGYQDRSAGDIGQAQEKYQRCLAIRERVLVEFGETPQRLRDLNSISERLAKLNQSAGNS